MGDIGLCASGHRARRMRRLRHDPGCSEDKPDIPEKAPYGKHPDAGSGRLASECGRCTVRQGPYHGRSR